MTHLDYFTLICEAAAITARLRNPARRKDTRLILRHMALCSRIHAYEAQRDTQAALDALAGEGV